MGTRTSPPSLLFVNQHYYPDVASTGQHLTDLAEHLVQDGFQVDVLCASAKYLAGDLESPKKEVHNGVRIRRVKTTGFGRGSHLGRILDYASFYLKVLWTLFTGRRVDLVVALTTPPLLGFACALARKVRGQDYAIWSMDLHPDAEESIGMIQRGSLLSRVLHGLNDFGYRNARLVVDLGPHMKRRLLNKGVLAERLKTIVVWNKKDEITPVDRADNPLVNELGLEGKFVVMYSGNAGLVHRFEEVTEVMTRLRDRDDLFFLFVGGGPRRPEIEAVIEAEGLTNAAYLDYFPREQLDQSLSLGNVHLLTLRNEAAGVAVPGKLYGVMAAGRPIIVVGPGASEPAETTLDEGVGRVVDTQTGSLTLADDLEAALLELAADPEACAEMGRRARAAFLARYEADVACGQWADTLWDLLDPAGRPAPLGRLNAGKRWPADADRLGAEAADSVLEP
ncbi:MAG: glycosyltransferase family 4 protein, partial [Bacteroidota bacterium]